MPKSTYNFRGVKDLLETKYSERGLSFTTDLQVGHGLASYGVIDGLRFCFSVRSSHARLSVGVVDDAGRKARYEKSKAIWDKAMDYFDKEVIDGLHDSEEIDWHYFYMENCRPKLELSNGVTDRPDTILFSASTRFERGNPLLAELTDNKVREIFEFLVAELAPAERVKSVQ